jgi:hypothetical protein
MHMQQCQLHAYAAVPAACMQQQCQCCMHALALALHADALPLALHADALALHADALALHADALALLHACTGTLSRVRNPLVSVTDWPD